MKDITSTPLAKCEEVIERGLGSFVEVGNALLTIRDGRLYKSAFSTFEAYCKERWGMQRAQAYRLIESAEVVGNLSPIGDKPETESQARPLAKLPADQQAEAWKVAVETAPEGKVTAKHVEEVVSARTRPIPDIQLTPEQEQRVAQAEKDSEQLWSIKAAWKRLSKKDKAAFKEWITNE